MPNTQGLPVGPALDFGWNTFKANVVFLVGVYIAAAMMIGLVGWADSLTNDRLDFAYFLAQLFVALIIEVGLVKIALCFEAGKPCEFANLFDGFDRVPNMFVALLIMYVAIAVGLVLLIVPGIIVAIRLMFTPYIVVDRRMGPIDALRESWEMTRGYGLDLFLLWVALTGINLLGSILFGVGVLATLPVTALATARIYRILSTARASAAVPPPAVEAPAS